MVCVCVCVCVCVHNVKRNIHGGGGGGGGGGCVCVKERESVKELFISTIIRFYHFVSATEGHLRTGTRNREREKEGDLFICARL